MIVSKIDGQYIYGVDLSEKGAEVFSISMEDYQKIESGIAIMKDYAVVDIPNILSKDINNEKEILEEQEKQIKSQAIQQKYTITDQLNLIRRVLLKNTKDKELSEMSDFIDSILSSEPLEGNLQ